MAFYPGAYAEYCLAWGDFCYPMADHVSFEQEAMRDILGVAVHAVGRADLSVGDHVLCIGGGPAAFCVAQVAKAKGATRVFVSDPSALAREALGRLDGITVFDPTVQSTQGVLNDHLGRAEVKVVFDSVGTASTMAIGLSVLAEMGTYVNLAVHDTNVQVHALSMGSERTITSSSNALYQDEREAHELILTGLVDVEAMITHRFALVDFEEAFSLLLSDPKQAYKVIFTSF
jgi:L-iditol 2-dehydrogenase